MYVSYANLKNIFSYLLRMVRTVVRTVCLSTLFVRPTFFEDSNRTMSFLSNENFAYIKLTDKETSSVLQRQVSTRPIPAYTLFPFQRLIASD